jgi:pyrroloquinoline quinone biosynthesis protein B
MILRVLGAAAGGGFPQWNCSCRNCAGLRAGTLRATPRTQSSVIVRGAAHGAWALVNSSPDVLRQLEACPEARASRTLRDTAITGIVLVDGQIDHTTGLYLLREATRPWHVWCTDAVHDDLTHGHPVLNVLKHYCGATHRRMPLGGEHFTVDGIEGVQWVALPVAGKPAPYSPRRQSPVAGDNVALLLTDQHTRRSLLYAPGLAGIEEHVWRAMQAASCVLVDGTFWSDDELIAQGLSAKRAQDMGHLALSGGGGMLENLARLPHGTRKILIHINNTNPILDEASPEAAEVTRLGIEVAFDGLEIEL